MIFFDSGFTFRQPFIYVPIWTEPDRFTFGFVTEKTEEKIIILFRIIIIFNMVNQTTNKPSARAQRLAARNLKAATQSNMIAAFKRVLATEAAERKAAANKKADAKVARATRMKVLREKAAAAREQRKAEAAEDAEIVARVVAEAETQRAIRVAAVKKAAAEASAAGMAAAAAAAAAAAVAIAQASSATATADAEALASAAADRRDENRRAAVVETLYNRRYGKLSRARKEWSLQTLVWRSIGIRVLDEFLDERAEASITTYMNREIVPYARNGGKNLLFLREAIKNYVRAATSVMDKAMETKPDGFDEEYQKWRGWDACGSLIYGEMKVDVFLDAVFMQGKYITQAKRANDKWNSEYEDAYQNTLDIALKTSIDRLYMRWQDRRSFLRDNLYKGQPVRDVLDNEEAYDSFRTKIAYLSFTLHETFEVTNDQLDAFAETYVPLSDENLLKMYRAMYEHKTPGFYF